MNKMNEMKLNIICVTLINFLLIIEGIPQLLIKGKLFLERERDTEIQRKCLCFVSHSLFCFSRSRSQNKYIISKNKLELNFNFSQYIVITLPVCSTLALIAILQPTVLGLPNCWHSRAHKRK